ncbi:tol-pal system-associated acyl-CoA thioesterase [Rhizobium sp. CRIBSB]|nr:tol-pal system-associated acyl-CoA thioesterase [Rhizobium sp. CRIBSB]
MTEIPTHGRFEEREHQLPVRVYYEDTDFTGLVYHGSYVRFFERGRTDALRTLGVGHSALLEDATPTAFVVSTMALRFLKPARIDDGLTVTTRFEAIRGPRLMIAQSIRRGDEVLCEADVVAVCIHLDGRPRRPDRLLVERVTPLLGREVTV